MNFIFELNIHLAKDVKEKLISGILKIFYSEFVNYVKTTIPWNPKNKFSL